MEESVEKLRPMFTELLAYRDDEAQPLTQQGMAEKLNADGVLSLTGQPWSKYSVRRILKKLGMQTATSASQGRAAPPVVMVSEHQLDENSPLRQWGYYESIRGVVEELTADNYTPQSLAKALNAREVATIDGSAWDKQSVERVLKTLKPSDAGNEFSDDEIRQRIRQGHYDTATERFVAVAVKAEKSKENKKEKKGKKSKKK
ncbi:MAG: hypothetical protein KDI68_10730 [Gammaproteobacteria bacterium]|nr:hypothetical protein [Gammaproteobacteria bacterium]